MVTHMLCIVFQHIGVVSQAASAAPMLVNAACLPALQATHCEGFVKLVKRFVELESQCAFKARIAALPTFACRTCAELRAQDCLHLTPF